MACRIGITTDINERRNYWLSVHPNMRNWQILHNNLSREQAQAIETSLASKYNCQASPGGNNPSSGGNNWIVYYFEY